jgi:hypothetical protein
MSDGPGRFSDQFNLRLPDGMRDRLKAEAEANKRSMNAEIVARIEDSFARAERDAALSTAEEAMRTKQMIAEYNFTAGRITRIHNDMTRMTEHLQRLEQALRQSGVSFENLPQPYDDTDPSAS